MQIAETSQWITPPNVAMSWQFRTRTYCIVWKKSWLRKRTSLIVLLLKCSYCKMHDTSVIWVFKWLWKTEVPFAKAFNDRWLSYRVSDVAWIYRKFIAKKPLRDLNNQDGVELCRCGDHLETAAIWVTVGSLTNSWNIKQKSSECDFQFQPWTFYIDSKIDFIASFFYK